MALRFMDVQASPSHPRSPLRHPSFPSIVHTDQYRACCPHLTAETADITISVFLVHILKLFVRADYSHDIIISQRSSSPRACYAYRASRTPKCNDEVLPILAETLRHKLVSISWRHPKCTSQVSPPRRAHRPNITMDGQEVVASSSHLSGFNHGRFEMRRVNDII